MSTMGQRQFDAGTAMRKAIDAHEKAQREAAKKSEIVNYIDRVQTMAESLEDGNTEGAAKLWAAMQEAKRQLKECITFAEEQLIQYIKDNGEIQFNEDVKLVVGTKKTDKQGDTIEIAKRVFDAMGVTVKDENMLFAFCDCLRSQPFKPATTRDAIGDNGELFWKEETSKIEIKKIDKRFIEKGGK